MDKAPAKNQEDPEVEFDLDDPASVPGPQGEGDGRHSDVQDDEIVEATE